jgi:hypothetical protein
MTEQVPDGNSDGLVQADGYAPISADKGGIIRQDEVA